MSIRAAAWIAWSLCLPCVVLAVASLILARLNGRTLGEIFIFPGIGTFTIQTVSFSVVGPSSPRTALKTPSAGSSWPRASAMGS
jgi:hypothetical protein